MKKKKSELIFIIIITFISSLLIIDQLIHPGEAATFDSQIHITNMANFHDAMADGDFPVVWADKFANYGLPTPLVSQQLTNYIGAGLIFITKNPLSAYKLTLLLGAIISSITFYFFLRIYASQLSSLVGVILFNFSAYRIFNIYVRGALPEFFAVIFIPLILIGLHKISTKQKFGIYLTIISSALLILTHPFVFVISQFLIIPYLFYLFLKTRSKALVWLALLSALTSIGLSAYYLIPLVLEMKYFVISKNETQFVYDQFLHLENYAKELWPYFTDNDVFVRGNHLQFGIIEAIILVTGIPYLLLKKDFQYKSFIKIFILPSSLLLIFFTLKISLPLYEHVTFLGNIQFPWRMLTALSLIPAILIALVLDSISRSYYFAILTVLVVLFLRIPQTYGKNYTYHPAHHYHKTIKNLHFDSMNTIWTGSTHTYPVRAQKGEIIEGSGEILERVESNALRNYQINAHSKVRMLDSTFYFPGWKVFVDDQETPIQFQDPNHRGVITYQVPQGSHQVRVVMQNTKIRLLGRFITAFFMLSILVIILLDKKFKLYNKLEKL